MQGRAIGGYWWRQVVVGGGGLCWLVAGKANAD